MRLIKTKRSVSRLLRNFYRKTVAELPLSLVHSEQKKIALEKLLNMFKVNNKDTLDIFVTFFWYVIVEFLKCCQLSSPAEFKGQTTSKNYETCNDRYNLCHINQTDQTTT